MPAQLLVIAPGQELARLRPTTRHQESPRISPPCLTFQRLPSLDT